MTENELHHWLTISDVKVGEGLAGGDVAPLQVCGRCIVFLSLSLYPDR